jgi:hypothetical protein
MPPAMREETHSEGLHRVIGIISSNSNILPKAANIEVKWHANPTSKHLIPKA